MCLLSNIVWVVQTGTVDRDTNHVLLTSSLQTTHVFFFTRFVSPRLNTTPFTLQIVFPRNYPRGIPVPLFEVRKYLVLRNNVFSPISSDPCHCFWLQDYNKLRSIKVSKFIPSCTGKHDLVSCYLELSVGVSVPSTSMIEDGSPMSFNLEGGLRVFGLGTGTDPKRNKSSSDKKPCTQTKGRSFCFYLSQELIWEESHSFPQNFTSVFLPMTYLSMGTLDSGIRPLHPSSLSTPPIDNGGPYTIDD